MDNYVEMRTPQERFHGIVCQNMRPVEIIRSIADELIELTQSLYGHAPKVEYRGNLDCILDYIPRRVKYMVRELLKNAFRATVERHLDSGCSGAELPAVAVELQQGDVHAIIKISDQGGGMSKLQRKEAWQYGWSSHVSSNGDSCEAFQYAEESCSWDRSSSDGAAASDASRRAELAGYGFGLPLTRLHAQYFGGDVFMQAVPGHGTDLFLLLTHLREGTPSCEIDDLSTVLYNKDNKKASSLQPP